MAPIEFDLADPKGLLQLAKSPDPKERDRLYSAIVEIFLARGPDLAENERVLMREILRGLTRQVERKLRLAVAERLADEPGAPHELILMLANDEAGIAAPVLENSRVLTSEDLMALVCERSEGHRTLIAGRQGIGEPVTNLIVERGGENSLVALVKNQTARISPSAFEQLVSQAATIHGLQAPLVDRSDLPENCVAELYTFVSDALRTAIRNTFPIDPDLLDRALADAQRAAAGQPDAPPPDEDEAADRLVSKLYASGQLTVGFVVKAAQDRQRAILERAAASLAQLDLETVRRALFSRDPHATALLLRTMGIDRSVFPSIHAVCREFDPSLPAISPEHRPAIDSAFALAKDNARPALVEKLCA